MDPINYGAMLPQMDIGQELLKGLQLGGAIRQQRVQQEQQAAAQERAKQYSADVGNALKTPTYQAFSELTIKYPEQREAIKQSLSLMSEGQRNAEFGLASKAFAALNTGNADIATQLYERQIAAKEGSGADASEEKMVLDAIKRDPVKAKGLIGYAMFHADPEKYAESVTKLGGELRAQEQAPAALQEAQGKATKAAAEAKVAEVTAKYADSQAVADLTKKGWDITKIEQDIGIAKETNRIKAMEAAAAREGNALKRDELKLKIEETKRGRDEKIRERTAEAETAITGIDKSSELLGSILADEDSLRAATGAGGWRAWIPGTDARTTAGKLEQLQNAIAATNLDKLKGAMSDKDIMFLKTMETNLDRFQNEEQFITELRRIDKALSKAREVVVKKYGAEGSTVAEGETLYEQHPTYGKVTTRRAQQLAREAGVSVDDVRRFLDEQAMQKSITDRVKGTTGIRPGQ